MLKSMNDKNSHYRQSQTMIWKGFALMSLLLVASLIFGTGCSQKALPPEIPVADVYKKYQEGVYILDVRGQEEWDEEHILGTTLIPLDELSNRMNEIPSDQEIIVICNTGNRSPLGRDILIAAGFERVTVARGGIRSWAIMDYPLEMQP